MRRPRTTVAALGLSAAALVGLVLHEGYSDRAIIPVKGGGACWFQAFAHPATGLFAHCIANPAATAGAFTTAHCCYAARADRHQLR